MKTLEEHNKDQSMWSVRSHRAGVKCDSCGTEMLYYDRGLIHNAEIVLTSFPGKREVTCPDMSCVQYKTLKYKVV